MESARRSIPFVASSLLASVLCFQASPVHAAGTGTIRGKVVGPDGHPMAAVVLQLRNDISGFSAQVTAASDGTFQFFNVPLNPYELHAEAQGFEPLHQSLDVRSSIPLEVTVSLKLVSLSETVTVSGERTAGQLETDTSTSHVDIDKSYISRAAATTASRAMEDLITATPGFAKDENGRFHFQGFHSQSQYVIDGQTISDQPASPSPTPSIRGSPSPSRSSMETCPPNTARRSGRSSISPPSRVYRVPSRRTSPRVPRASEPTRAAWLLRAAPRRWASSRP